MKKIVSLIFKNLKLSKPNQQVNLEITFGNTNIIVGPKGGGKSSLFELLAAADEGLVPDGIRRFFMDELGLEPFKITYDNGEARLFNSLDKYKIRKTDTFHRLDKYNHIIRQDDYAKKTLDSMKAIEDQKRDVVKGQLEQLKSDAEFRKQHFQVIFDFVEQLEYFRAMQDGIQTNWSSFFKIDNAFDLSAKSSLITKVDFDTNQFKIDSKNFLDKLTKLKQTYESSVRALKVLVEEINDAKSKANLQNLFSSEFQIEITGWFEEERLSAELKIKAIERESKLIRQKIMVVEVFQGAFKKLKEDEKRRDFAKKGIMQFCQEGKDFFKKVANQVRFLQTLFDKVLGTDIEFDPMIDEVSKSDPALRFKSSKVRITMVASDETKTSIEKLLEKFLYVPNVKANLSEWIKSYIERGPKQSNNSEDNFWGEVEKAIVETTKVFAEDKEYDKMSPGEKSIFGIKFKLKHATKTSLFLDQPEDNLDNYSISKNVLQAIQAKQAENVQLFIVTHNANIGILVKPDKVLVAKIDQTQPDVNTYYSEKTAADLSDNPKAYYLEGGFLALEERYNILKGENHGN